MMHEQRIFHVTRLPENIRPVDHWSESLAHAIEAVDDLAEKLTTRTWLLCSGFQLGELLFLNDAFSEDGAQEYVVVKDGYQIESVTFSWITHPNARSHLNKLFNGRLGRRYRRVAPRLDFGPCHRCELCK